MAFVAIQACLPVFPARRSASGAASSLRSAPLRTGLPQFKTSTRNRVGSLRYRRRPCRAAAITASLELDLTEDNVRQAIDDAKAEASEKTSFHPSSF
jgi:hypothetical protein